MKNVKQITEKSEGRREKKSNGKEKKINEIKNWPKNSKLIIKTKYLRPTAWRNFST